MAQIAKPEAEKIADTVKNVGDNLTEQGKRTIGRAADLSREISDKSEDIGRRGLQVVEKAAGAVGEVQREVTQRSAEGIAEFGQVVAEMLKEQTQYHVETLSALSGAVDWEQVVKAVDWKQVAAIQTSYLRASTERMAQMTQRYFDISQAVMGSAMSVVATRAKRAA